MEIPFVWMSLIEKSDSAEMLQKSATSQIPRERAGLIEKDLLLKVINNKSEPMLVNDDLKTFHALILL